MGKFNPESPYIAFDTEATGLNVWGTPVGQSFCPARPFAYSFCDWSGATFYVRWKVNPKNREVLPDPQSYKIVKRILENPQTKKIGHNVGYDLRMSDMMGINVRGPIHDSLIMAHVVTGGGRSVEFGD